MLFRLAAVTCLMWTSSAFASFSSIAYSPATGHYGFAAGGQSRAWVEEQALRACGMYGCEVAVTVQNGYVALSMDRRGSVYVGAASSSKETSWDSALDLCERNSRHRCTILAFAGAVDCQPRSPVPVPDQEQGPVYDPSQDQGPTQPPRTLPRGNIRGSAPNSGPSYPAPVWR